MIDRDIY